jgi:hypothetical protein
MTRGSVDSVERSRSGPHIYQQQLEFDCRGNYYQCRTDYHHRSSEGHRQLVVSCDVQFTEVEVNAMKENYV